MTFAHVHARGWGYGSDRSKVELKRLRSLGVNWIAISPFAYQRRVDDPQLYFGAGDPSLREVDLIAVTEQAHELGMKVLLKPHIWSHQYWSEGKWAGDIEMKSDADSQVWFDQYRAYITSNAKLAETAHIDGLCIGLEFVKMTTHRHTDRWRALIEEVRALYRGPLTYGAHHEVEAEQIEFWDALDAIGVDAYYPLGADLEHAAADAIARAWGPYLGRLQKLSERYQKPVVFTELGFPSHAGALATPWHSDRARASDEGLQARAYEGTMRALAGARFLRGVFWWKWFSGGPDNPHEHDPYDPEGKAAEQVISKWFTGT